MFGEPQTVVVCGRDGVGRGTVVQLLRRLGHRALDSGPLPLAASVVRLAHPDLVVLLVDGDGPDAWRTLGSVQEAAPRIPILVMNGRTAHALLRAGAWPHSGSPTDIEGGSGF